VLPPCPCFSAPLTPPLKGKQKKSRGNTKSCLWFRSCLCFVPSFPSLLADVVLSLSSTLFSWPSVTPAPPYTAARPLPTLASSGSAEPLWGYSSSRPFPLAHQRAQPATSLICHPGSPQVHQHQHTHRGPPLKHTPGSSTDRHKRAHFPATRGARSATGVLRHQWAHCPEPSCAPGAPGIRQHQRTHRHRGCTGGSTWSWCRGWGERVDTTAALAAAALQCLPDLALPLAGSGARHSVPAPAGPGLHQKWVCTIVRHVQYCTAQYSALENSAVEYSKHSTYSAIQYCHLMQDAGTSPWCTIALASALPPFLPSVPAAFSLSGPW